MFGYVFPDKAELKVREYELFKAYYCGLCKSIGKNYNQISRFLLNYDMTFLGIFLSSFALDTENIKIENCIAHVASKRPVIHNNKYLEYAADMNILLAYYKLMDDIKDEHSIKAMTIAPLLYSSHKKAENRNQNKSIFIKEKLEELSYIEKNGCSSIDEAAEPFSKLTEEIFSCELIHDYEKQQKSLRYFGYNLGKWIYLIDAFNDIEKDIKKESFNPILRVFKYSQKIVTKEALESYKNSILENISFTLKYTLSQAASAFELMDIKKNKEILENIIYGGMYKKTLYIINKGRCTNNEESI